MNKKLRSTVAAAILVLSAEGALAGSGTLTVLDSTGATQTFNVTTDGSAHYIGKSTLCDGTAAANCAAVKAASTPAATTDPAGVFQVSPESPMFGTAGTASTEALTVQGIASMTPLATNVTQVLGSALSATNGLYSNLLQGNTVLSTTNGLYSNLLQGNVALTGANPLFSALSIAGSVDSATNGIYSNLLQGNAVLSATNGGYQNLLQGNAALATTNALPVAPNPYPLTAVPITASATGTTAATTATLTNVSGHTTYICGFSIRANATAAATGNATITGTITGTMNFTQWTAPLASGLGIVENTFTPCVPASAVSTSIAVISAAPGSGGVVSVSAWGYSI